MSVFDRSENDRAIWRDVRENIRWSMKDPGADRNGQRMMIHAVGERNVSYMGEFKDGFYETQDKPTVRAQFRYCCELSEIEVYNFGREVAGYPPI